MRARLSEYLELAKTIRRHWWVDLLLALWTLLAAYDLLLSQLIPEEYSRKAPKAWEAAVMAGGWLPWWGWMLVLAAILVIGSLEFAFRVARSSRGRHFVAHASPQVSANSNPVPDWPIREVFYLLAPSLTTNPADDVAGVVGLQIKDKLSTGELGIWGRRATSYGRRSPPTAIDSTYWDRANFTYLFLDQDDNARYLIHTEPDPHSGLAAYRDLQVNQAQALKLWRKTARAMNADAKGQACPFCGDRAWYLINSNLVSPFDGQPAWNQETWQCKSCGKIQQKAN